MSWESQFRLKDGKKPWEALADAPTLLIWLGSWRGLITCMSFLHHEWHYAAHGILFLVFGRCIVGAIIIVNYLNK